MLQQTCVSVATMALSNVIWWWHACPFLALYLFQLHYQNPNWQVQICLIILDWDLDLAGLFYGVEPTDPRSLEEQSPWGFSAPTQQGAQATGLFCGTPERVRGQRGGGHQSNPKPVQIHFCPGPYQTVNPECRMCFVCSQSQCLSNIVPLLKLLWQRQKRTRRWT